MRPLSEYDILHVWEVGLIQHPLDRAVSILNIAEPEASRDALVSLSMGQRDRRLLIIREQTFGSKLTGFTECPGCHERLEFTFHVDDLLAKEGQESPLEIQQVSAQGLEMTFRVPTTTDLQAIANSREADKARHRLIQRCVLQATQDGEVLSLEAIPDTVLATVEERMLTCDPLADIELNLTCAACGNGWQTAFDILSFLWAEISAHAKCLLREIHILARAYGWREADILAMGASRRQTYLAMVTT
jgi:hypothetical protein